VRRTHPVLVVVVAAVLLAAGLVAAGMVGSTIEEPARVLSAAVARLDGVQQVSGADRLITELRLPRGVLSAVVGATLALVGAVLQTLVANPLADPTILGGASGAGLGAVLVIVLGAGGLLAGATLAVGAFLGAAAGFGLTLALAWQRSGLSPLRTVLAGVGVSYALSALTQLVIVSAGDDRRLRSAVFWQLGSVASAQWDTLAVPATVLLVGAGWLVLRARRLDALAFGDQTAFSLGVHPGRLRLELFVTVAVLTGVSVSVAGGVGFVALVVPHAVRLLVGPGHAALLPCCVLAGAAFLVWADVAGRVVAAPNEMPLGVVTALVGAPVFAVLVRRRMRAAA
jgi:iron complex transport system permease protein